MYLNWFDKIEITQGSNERERDGCPPPLTLLPPHVHASFLYNDFADLHDRSNIGIVGDVSHNLLRVRSETFLERFDRVGEDVTHADVCRGSSRRSACKSLVHGVILAA